MEEIIFKECKSEELTHAEKIKLQQWLSESSHNRKVYAQLKLALLSPDEQRREEIKEEVWGLINESDPTSIIDKKPVVNMGYWVRIAAILVLGISLAIFLRFYGPLTQDNLVEFKVIEKVSLPGQHITTKLPDGTIVQLNGDSKIIFPENFKDEMRNVQLQGEAFFEVKRDESKPFIISTHDIQVRVLGTSFNVKSYPEEDQSIVAVATGKVAVSDISDEEMKLNLLPGEKVTHFRLENRGLLKEKYDFESELGWTEKMLVFKESQFDQITKELSRWYGVEFEITNTKIDFTQKFSGRYEDPTINGVLEGISFVYGFKYEITGNKILIK